MLFTRNKAIKKPSHARIATDLTPELLSIDTLAQVLRTLATYSLPTIACPRETFVADCEHLARKILVKKGVDASDFKALQRIHTEVRTVVRTQREAESREYARHQQSASIILQDLVAGLRTALEDRQGDDTRMVEALTDMETAVAHGDLPAIRKVCSRTVTHIKDVIATRRETDKQQLASLSNQLRAMKTELEETQAQMERDPLTELHNRGSFENAFGQTVKIANASATELTLYMVDLDHFKRVNDTFGHPAGDAVLRAVAKQLIRCFPRKDDMVARYGGEEFAILCKNTGQKDAFMLGERMRTQIADTQIQLDGHPYHPTASIGFAVLRNQEDHDALLKRADAALYEAKTGGRNRVVPST